MNILPGEIWQIIIEFIETNKDKCRMLMTCKDMSKCKFYFRQFIHINNCIKITKSIWYNYFTNILCDNTNISLPKYTKKMIFSEFFSGPIINGFIPSTVTHVKFNSFFNRPINNCIPSSVKHLIFGSTFNRPIENYLPTSITHLTFGFRFNHPIKNNIPTSVTHLVFGECFNQSLMEIPSSVTHLKLTNHIFHDTDLPSFVKEIEFYYDRWGDISEKQEKAIYEYAKKYGIGVIIKKDY